MSSAAIASVVSYNLQDVVSYQAMLEKLNYVETLEAIRQGFEEAERGESRPASVVFAELSAKHGVSLEELDYARKSIDADIKWGLKSG